MKPPRKKWTAAEDEELKRLYPDMLNREVGECLGVTAEQIKSRATVLGLSKSKAHIQAISKTRRSNLNKANRWQPIGLVKKWGHKFMIKASQSGDKAKDWRPLSEHVWITNGGEPPKADEVIVLKDGATPKAKECFQFEHLEKITRRELMSRNTIHRYPDELKSAMRMLGQLKKEIEK